MIRSILYGFGIFCEFFWVGTLIYLRLFADFKKTREFFEHHRVLQITVPTLCLIGFATFALSMFHVI